MSSIAGLLLDVKNMGSQGNWAPQVECDRDIEHVYCIRSDDWLVGC